MKYPLILLALSACAHAHAQTTAAPPNPLDPNAPAPTIKHDSALAGYRPFDDSPPLQPQAEATVRGPGSEPAHPPESAVKDAAITPHHHH